MGEDRQPDRWLRFGVFELDLRAGELRKQGVRVRIQQQPFQVLSTLVEHPGEIVTREELQKKLWPADTFVNFDHGLNKAVNKVREALSDSAESPRFVETVGRRGYRFLVEVKPGVNGAGYSPQLSHEPAEPFRDPRDVDSPRPLTKSPRRPLIWKISLVALFLVGTSLAGWKLYSRSHSSSV